MQHSLQPTALHAALRFVITSEMPAEHKATSIEVLTQAIRDEGAATLRREAHARSQGEWQDPEIVRLKSFLHGRVATSWQHADECVMHLATQLHRDPAAVRHKATELGLGSAVDYRVARQLKPPGRE
jgi:sarcosine oxidase delta subunit